MAAVGVLLGIILGALPGFTAARVVVFLLPLTCEMNAASGLILLGAPFGSARHGGYVAAILINTPGTPSAAAMVLDGYPMAQKGLAGQALRESVCASFIGGIMGVTVLLFPAPPLAKISLMFGPPEYFLLAIFALTIIVSLSEKALIKGFLAGVFGLMISTVGMDPLLGFPRFIFGLKDLVEGIELVPALIGLFSIPEVLEMIKSHKEKVQESGVSLRKIKIEFPPLKHIVNFIPIYLRSIIIGIIIFILPGAGGSIASFITYNEIRRVSKYPEKFGTGIPEGVAAAESAKNAMSSGALIPMLTLGVPGDSVAAIRRGWILIRG